MRSLMDSAGGFKNWFGVWPLRFMSAGSSSSRKSVRSERSWSRSARTRFAGPSAFSPSDAAELLKYLNALEELLEASERPALNDWAYWRITLEGQRTVADVLQYLKT